MVTSGATQTATIGLNLQEVGLNRLQIYFHSPKNNFGLHNNQWLYGSQSIEVRSNEFLGVGLRKKVSVSPGVSNINQGITENEQFDCFR